jgi:hypothetical protein
MEYKGVPVDDMYKLWTEHQELVQKRKDAGKVWDATYREKHREERNRKAKEYYERKKQKKVEYELSIPCTQIFNTQEEAGYSEVSKDA